MESPVTDVEEQVQKGAWGPEKGRPLQHHEASLSDYGSQEVRLWVGPEFTRLSH